MVLLPWQARLFRILFALFVVLLINSVVLWTYTSTPNPPLAYYVQLLFHFALGLLLIVPFTVYAVSHSRRARGIPNRAAVFFGELTAGCTLLCMGVGTYMFALALGGGAVTRNVEWWTLYAHRVTGFAIPLLYFLHMRARAARGYKAALATAVMLACFVGGLTHANAFTPPPEARLQPMDPFEARGHNPFFPSSAKSSTGEVLPVNLLLTSQACARCHEDIFKQWNESAHHFSSFNNPWYRKSIEYMRGVSGAEATQWCAGCHDQALLFPGIMKMKEKMHLPESHAGVACMVCHGITHVADTTGNASYTLAPPPEYPWEGSGNPIESGLSDFLIRVKPAPHRQAMLKPFHEEAEFCSTCHKVSLQEGVNRWRWFRGFNDYDGWQGSGVSGMSARSFYQPKAPMKCADCHMPRVPSRDFGAKDGMVHDHRFAAANTALPTLNKHPEQLRKVVEFLKTACSLDLFAVTPAGPAPADATAVAAGQEVRLDLVVRTRKLGHPFPTGTADAFEIWTELKAVDARGRVVFWNGFVGADGAVDPSAHFFGPVLVDGRSRRINKRNAFVARSVVYVEAVPPGAAKVVRHRLRLPADAALPVAVEARLHYRKFDRYYHQFTFNGRTSDQGKHDPVAGYDDRAWKVDGPVPIEMPDVVMAERRVVLGQASVEAPLWERWNDYGIAMFLANDLKAARQAWKKVVEADPAYADGYVNVARATLSEGDVAGALSWLDRALQLKPGFYKARYLKGIALQQQGRWEEAAAELRAVSGEFPRDREVLDRLGRVLFLLEDFEGAVAQYDAALDIDAEDLTAHQGLTLCWRALGNEEKAVAHEQHYLRYKADETRTRHNGPFLRTHPEQNREAQPIHEHVTSR